MHGGAETPSVPSFNASDAEVSRARERALATVAASARDEHRGTVTCLRLVGTGRKFDLPVTQEVFHLGSSIRNDIVIRHERVSRIHARLTRMKSGLHVEDLGSKNGVSMRGLRQRDLDVGVGGTFSIANAIELLLVDDRLRRLRRELARGFGLHSHAVVDDALTIAQTGAPLAFIGPRGCGQEQMARAIADATRSKRRFLSMRSVPGARSAWGDLVRSVRFGTVLLDLHVISHVPPELMGAFLDHERGARVVMSAPDHDTLARAVGPFKPVFWTTDVPPLARRSSEIPRLLAQRIWELGQRDIAAQVLRLDLVDFSQGAWQGNLDELHDTAPVMIALLAIRTASGAARQLGWPIGRMRHWLSKYRVPAVVGRG